MEPYWFHLLLEHHEARIQLGFSFVDILLIVLPLAAFMRAGS